MENNFQFLDFEEQLPDKVKNETFGYLDSMKLFFDLVDLFWVKAGSTAAHALENRQGETPLTLMAGEEENKLIE